MINGIKSLKALADETRLRALCALRGQELCVCQLIEMLQLAPSTVSKHLTILKDAGLVDSRKNGRWVYYRESDFARADLPPALLGHLVDSLSASETMRSDAVSLAHIVKLSPDKLCERQRGC